ncbi:peptidase associated/transthyretin-like domain-containing protein [Pedobacter duraquae]|uniref:Carboxypeptidase-like protein n=1 Tax=Pedobacter duraquae TaxID=425511 RepID=A0A4R6IFR3_9SPHI|nr:hypothetical protein [Pedobacter duraquae]TDO20942.1 hypothetical protein CLV32_3579 [Pedobacter duraquae]
MDLPRSLKLTLLLIFTSVIWCFAQNANTIRGVVVQDGTKARIEQVTIGNKRSGQRVSSDKLGLFELICKIGDTLMIERIGYQELKIRVQNYAELTIHLKPTNLLNEVSITGQRASAQLREISATYSKEKGIFYGGKPPLRLLSPFGGSPVTFFYELLGKDGRRVRRLNQLAKDAAEAEEISRYFNDLIIRNTVAIDSNQLDAFKLKYTPKLDQLKRWSAYDRANYIKSSFEEFRKKEN